VVIWLLRWTFGSPHLGRVVPTGLWDGILGRLTGSTR
jgi:hypothetical protein